MYKIVIRQSYNPFNSVYYVEYEGKIIDYIDNSVDSLLNIYPPDVTKRITNKRLYQENIPDIDDDTEIVYFDYKKIEESIQEFIYEIENDPEILLNHNIKVFHDIEDMKLYLQKLIPIAQSLLNATRDHKSTTMSDKFHKYTKQPSDFNINDSEYDMLVDQLVFDILLNYYEEKSKKITRYKFAYEIAPIIYKNNSIVFVRETYTNRINQRMINTMSDALESYYTRCKKTINLKRTFNPKRIYKINRILKKVKKVEKKYKFKGTFIFKGFDKYNNTVTWNGLVMPDIDSMLYVNHLITPKKQKESELDLNAIHSCLKENQVLSKYPGYKVPIYKYIQNMSIVSITTKKIISLLHKIDNFDDSHEQLTVKYVTDKLDQLNHPVAEYNNPYKERSFASWLGLFFDNTFVPKKIYENEYTIKNSSELRRIVDSLNKYEAAIKRLRPSTDIDTPIKIFSKSIELYSIIFHKRIEIILDYYMSTMDLAHLENDKKEIIMKSFSKWVNQDSILVSAIDIGNENNSYFSYETAFSPMIFIEQKLYRKALEDIISENNSNSLEAVIHQNFEYIQAIHLVRFKTLELFRYHARFNPKPKIKCYSPGEHDNYKYSPIADFLLNNYNLRKYSDEIWEKANEIKSKND